MFTGIVEEIGTVLCITRGRHSAMLKIGAKNVLQNTKVGDSIAVNGVCLTVTQTGTNFFLADVMHETLNRSSLAKLRQGSYVNLERAMPSDGRFGGHFVMGHIDGIGKICRIRKDDTAVWYTIQVQPELMPYIVEKGSVAIDGISLTVAAVTKTDFSVSAIPHTVSQTVLKMKREGYPVNVEVDIIGKYIEKLMVSIYGQKNEKKITREFLSQYDF